MNKKLILCLHYLKVFADNNDRVNNNEGSIKDSVSTSVSLESVITLSSDGSAITTESTTINSGDSIEVLTSECSDDVINQRSQSVPPNTFLNETTYTNPYINDAPVIIVSLFIRLLSLD